MYTILRTEEFDSWLAGLKDHKAQARVLARIRSAALGNLGDVDSIGGGVREMRIHVGPGYRVYFTQRGKGLFLLFGGDKSTQKRDIAHAKALAQTTDD